MGISSRLVVVLGLVFSLQAFGLNSFSVATYGARADGGADATAAIQGAINAAIASHQPSEVVLGAGTYRLDCGTGDYCLTINGARSLTLRGQGAATQLMISQPLKSGVAVLNSSNVTVTGFAIDYSTVPYTQGTITRVQAGAAIDLAIDAGFPLLDSAQFSAGNFTNNYFFGSLFAPNSVALKGNVSHALMLTGVTKNADGTFHVGLSADQATLGMLTVGDHFATGNRSGFGFYANESTNVTLSQVTIYAAPGLATAWVGNYGKIVIDGVQVRRRPGSNRLLSSSADAIHMASNRAHLTIQNCYIESMLDDALNIRSEHFQILSVSSANSFCVPATSKLQIGDVFQVVAGQSPNRPRGAANIVGLSTASDGTKVVTLNANIAGLVANDIGFDQELAMPYAVIRNNTFSSFRGQFRIRSSGALFLNNQILDARNAMVDVDDDIAELWQEGPSLVNSLNGVYFNGNAVAGGGSIQLDGQTGGLGAPALSGDRAVLTHPLVFNSGNYRALNPDLAAYSDKDLIDHWVNHGIQEGRQALVYFKASEYLQLYSDLSTAYCASNYAGAIQHFLIAGFNEQRAGTISTHPFVFNSKLYRELNPDLGAYDDNAIGIHWLMHGIGEGRRATLAFHASEYLQLYPDLRTAYGATNYAGGISHFVVHGVSEGRHGSILTNPLVYDSRAYRLLNSDIASYDDNAIGVHWILHGVYEGRQAQIAFHASEYLQRYSDLRNAFGASSFLSGIYHFVAYGSAEGRKGSIFTDPMVYSSSYYRSVNPDIASYDDVAIGAHWILHGIDEGRRASALFFSVDYLNRYPLLKQQLGPTNYRGAVDDFVLGGYAAGRTGT